MMANLTLHFAILYLVVIYPIFLMLFGVDAAVNKNFNANTNVALDASLVQMLKEAPSEGSSFEGFTRGLMNEVYYNKAQKQG